MWPHLWDVSPPLEAPFRNECYDTLSLSVTFIGGHWVCVSITPWHKGWPAARGVQFAGIYVPIHMIRNICIPGYLILIRDNYWLVTILISRPFHVQIWWHILCLFSLQQNIYGNICLNFRHILYMYFPEEAPCRTWKSEQVYLSSWICTNDHPCILVLSSR